MREIKFRAWDKINKKMEEVDGYNLYIADGRMFEIYEASYAYETYMSKNDVTDKYILMQYTGLHDRNGREIYEGDVLFHRWNSGYDMQEETISEVKWLNGAFIVDDKKRADWLLSIHSLAEHWASVEVIGNIYENPELLKGDGNA